MKKSILLVPILLSIINSMAQLVSPVGVYYLDGVMETASGFKLNADSTFEFFFSQGALDRTGKGTWSRNGNQLVFHSNGKQENGFILVNSEKRNGKQATILVKESNSMLLSFVYARMNNGPNDEFMKQGSDGLMISDQSTVKQIELLFELCPERVHVFEPVNRDDNYFEFNFHPSIMEVYFNDFTLNISEDGLNGKHPLLEGGDFLYRKE